MTLSSGLEADEDIITSLVDYSTSRACRCLLHDNNVHDMDCGDGSMIWVTPAGLPSKRESFMWGHHCLRWLCNVRPDADISQLVPLNGLRQWKR
ncbi:hypothetical protein [Salinivibrio costicola]|uniref:hypothetical protein n=1 Tax=Salinivibrio costicola TaxID=51367 RepID=UPI0013E3363F|nr:hypothetical protein [Salinivibrio costicola]